MLHSIVVVTVLFGTKILKESFDIVCFVDNLYGGLMVKPCNYNNP